MHNRGTDDEFGFENVSDLEIEELLASDDPDDVEREKKQKLGLVILVARKRSMFCGHLRKLSNNSNWRLGSEDIVQIWEATFDSIRKNVVDLLRFRVTGHLNGYIRWILYCRTVDFLRRRIPIDSGFDLMQIEKGPEKRDERPEAQIVRMILCRVAKAGDLETTDEANWHLKPAMFGDNEWLVLRHLAELSLDGNAKLKPKALAKSVNIQRIDEGQSLLSVTAVRMSLKRAVNKLPGKGDLE